MTKIENRLSRRTMFGGAGAIGVAAAVAAVATLLPSVPQPDMPVEAKAPPEKGGGYQLTEHVKRYYQTTRT
jgi:hypothetical protein